MGSMSLSVENYNYYEYGTWSLECQNLSLECGCREEEVDEDQEMENCAANCPNPRASECYIYYKENGVWMDGCEQIMADCGCIETDEELDCYKKALNYIRENLTFEPNNTCAVLAYVKEHFVCSTKEIVPPDDPVFFPDLNLPLPDPGSNDNLPGDDTYNEAERKPIWWYHTDHLGSSTYLTDNFGRPSHYYETLPFGEIEDSPNSKIK